MTMCRLAYSLLILQILVLDASAGIPSFLCGNPGNPPCSATDKDADGIAAGVDCDDSDFLIFPGVVTDKGCTAGQTHRCQSDGTYTACTAATVCEASVGSACKYIDCSSGSDTTGNGSFANPWRSLKMVTHFTDGTLKPTGWYQVKAGDVVYLKGSGTCTDTFLPGGGDQSSMLTITASGTADKPITFKRYPGSTAVLDPANHSKTNPGSIIKLSSANYIKLEDLDLTGNYSSVIYGVLANHVEITRVNCHDNQGNNNDNLSCVNFASEPSYNYIHHNSFSDIADPDQPGEQNVGLVVFFRGVENRFEYNRFFYSNSPASSSIYKGACLRYKHPSNTGTVIVKGNQFANCKGAAFFNSTAGVRMSNNLLVNSPDYRGGAGYGCANIGSSLASCRDGIVENNTFVNARAFDLSQTAIDVNLGTTIFRNNIVVDNVTAYNSENGFFRIARYGSDADYAKFVALPALVSSGNCFYNPNTSLKFDFFADSPNTTGEYASFSGWKSLGFDTDSENEDPELNSSYEPTAECIGKGWHGDSPPSPSNPSSPAGLHGQIR